MAKYSKFKTKVHPLSYVILAILIALVAVVVIFSVPSSKTKIYNEYYQTQIKTEQFNGELIIEKDHVFTKINVKDLEKKIEQKGLVILYIGGTWCPYCLNEVGIYSSELKKNEELLEKSPNIFYLAKPADKDIEGLAELFEKLGAKEPTTYPTLISFYDGKPVEAVYTIGSQEPKEIKTTVRNYFDKVLEEIK